jgi:hypothetical protein
LLYFPQKTNKQQFNEDNMKKISILIILICISIASIFPAYGQTCPNCHEYFGAYVNSQLSQQYYICVSWGRGTPSECETIVDGWAFNSGLINDSDMPMNWAPAWGMAAALGYNYTKSFGYVMMPQTAPEQLRIIFAGYAYSMGETNTFFTMIESMASDGINIPMDMYETYLFERFPSDVNARCQACVTQGVMGAGACLAGPPCDYNF